jgi:hypothetical protein
MGRFVWTTSAKPNPSSPSSIQKRKKKSLAAGRGHVMSLSSSDPVSLFWLTVEIKIYPNKMKFLFDETTLCSQIFTGLNSTPNPFA